MRVPGARPLTAAVFVVGTLPPLVVSDTRRAPSGSRTTARRRRNQRRLLRGVCGVVVATTVALVSTGCGIGQLKPAGAAARAFGAAIAGQQWASAASMVCSADRATLTAAAFSDRFSTPAITGFSLGGVQIADVNGHTTAQAELVFHTASGIDSNVTVPLVDQDQQWRPCP